jgi:hypothetical protein
MSVDATGFGCFNLLEAAAVMQHLSLKGPTDVFAFGLV